MAFRVDQGPTSHAAFQLQDDGQWGKSTVTAVKAVHRAYFRPESLTLVVSPSARQSGEFVRKAAGLVQRLGLKPRRDGDNEISLMLIDEAARVSDEMYRSVRPMLAVTDGDLWLMSTPHGKRGFFWEAWGNGGPEWVRVAAPATECPRIPASFLEEERRSLGSRWFRQEYLCEFVENEECVFSRELIERAFTDEVEPLDL